jgi:hypothetical protein
MREKKMFFGFCALLSDSDKIKILMFYNTMFTHPLATGAIPYNIGQTWTPYNCTYLLDTTQQNIYVLFCLYHFQKTE